MVVSVAILDQFPRHPQHSKPYTPPGQSANRRERHADAGERAGNNRGLSARLSTSFTNAGLSQVLICPVREHTRHGGHICEFPG